MTVPSASALCPVIKVAPSQAASIWGTAVISFTVDRYVNWLAHLPGANAVAVIISPADNVIGDKNQLPPETVTVPAEMELSNTSIIVPSASLEKPLTQF